VNGGFSDSCRWRALAGNSRHRPFDSSETRFASLTAWCKLPRRSRKNWVKGLSRRAIATQLHMQKAETKVFPASREFAKPLPTAILVCLVAVVCYYAVEIAYGLGIPPAHIASFWSATPFLVAVLLLAPKRIWPLLVAGGLMATAISDFKSGVTIASEIWYTLGNLVDVVIAGWGIHLLFHGTPRLRNVNALAKYFAVSVILAPCVSALVGANGLTSAGYWLEWRIWFFADALGFLTVTPAILSWAQEGRAWRRDYRNYLELAVLLTCLALFGSLAFMGSGWRNSPALLYLLVPVLLWAVLRLGLKGVSVSMLVIAFLSIWGAAHDRGPFTGQGPLNNTLSLQLFLFFAAIPFMVFAVIVEEEKQTRQELVAERAQLTEAQRLAQMGSWSWEPSTDRVTWSEELYRIAGRDPGMPPLRHHELRALYTAESWNRLESAIEEALAAGTAYELDLEMIRPDGSTRWVRARREAQRASDGQLAQLHGTLQDITGQKLAETALRESEARFHDLFRNAGVGMIIVSPDGHFIAANEIFCDYLGYTEEELCQMTVQDVTQPEDWPQFSAKLREALETKISFQRFEKRCRHKSGRTVYTESSASLIRTPSGEPRYFVGEVLDVTERRRAEEALSTVSQRLIEAQEEERTRIARELHDDINQQIASLAVRLDCLNLSASARELRREVETVRGLVENVGSDIQALSHRLHSSKLEHLGLAKAAAGSCKEFSDLQKVEIDFHSENVPRDLPSEISLCLFRVLQEALQNAVKHSGSRHFQVSLVGGKDRIALTVQDSGIGFEPGEAVTGRGLGLTSMKERLKLVNGQLSIDSKLQQGTTIQACVPVGTRVRSVGAVG